jgi:hypothetical protein
VLAQLADELVEPALAWLVDDPPAVDQRAEGDIGQPTHRSPRDVVEHPDRGIGKTRLRLVEHLAPGVAEAACQSGMLAPQHRSELVEGRGKRVCQRRTGHRITNAA